MVLKTTVSQTHVANQMGHKRSIALRHSLFKWHRQQRSSSETVRQNKRELHLVLLKQGNMVKQQLRLMQEVAPTLIVYYRSHHRRVLTWRQYLRKLRALISITTSAGWWLFCLFSSLCRATHWCLVVVQSSVIDDDGVLFCRLWFFVYEYRGFFLWWRRKWKWGTSFQVMFFTCKLLPTLPKNRRY